MTKLRAFTVIWILGMLVLAFGSFQGFSGPLDVIMLFVLGLIVGAVVRLYMKATRSHDAAPSPVNARQS